MSIHVSACAPIDFDEGNDGIIRDFSYDCGWQELSSGSKPKNKRQLRQ